MYFGNDTSDLSDFLMKMNNGELTVEDVLNEDEIIQELKKNDSSQFVNFLTNENIQKLMDYATKFPASDEHNIGYKYPFNATEILCAPNRGVQNKIMSEVIINKKNPNQDKLKLALFFQQRLTKNGFIENFFNTLNNLVQEENKKNENEEKLSENEESSEEEDEEEIEDQVIRDEGDDKIVIYENIDHLFGFLKEPEETKKNYVLVGYFYKIFNSLLNSPIQALKIVQYIYNYPKKKELDVMNLLVQHMNRKSMCDIIYKLLVYTEEDMSNMDDKRIILFEKVLDKFDQSKDKNMYECISNVLCTTLNNKNFFNIFMKKPELFKKIFSIIKNIRDEKKLIALLKLLIIINDNILQHFETHYTTNLAQENNIDFLTPNYDTCYSQDEKNTEPEIQEAFQKLLLVLFELLKENNFCIVDDLVNSKENNEEFLTTYLRNQKKLGMKRLEQTEYLRTIFDIMINSYASNYYKNEIDELIEIINNKKILWALNDLFFDFPFNNLYQTFYNQIIDILLNEHAPEKLITYLFENNKNEPPKKLISTFMDHVLNKLKFKFNSNNYSFDPCFSFSMTILNKILISPNSYVKSYINDDKDFEMFNETLGQDIEKIYNQKLLLSDSQGMNFGDSEDECILPSFGPKSLMELLEDDIKIFNLYKSGGDYKKALEEKRNNEKLEQQKNEKKEPKRSQFIDDLEEEEDPLFKIEKINNENENDNNENADYFEQIKNNNDKKEENEDNVALFHDKKPNEEDNDNVNIKDENDEKELNKNSSDKKTGIEENPHEDILPNDKDLYHVLYSNKNKSYNENVKDENRQVHNEDGKKEVENNEIKPSTSEGTDNFFYI